MIIFNDRISDYSDLLKKANTCTIGTRWTRQLVTEIYKAVGLSSIFQLFGGCFKRFQINN